MSRVKSTKILKYIDAGVDISEGEALVKDITPHALRTKRAGSDNNIGGFGGLFDIQAAGFKDPILVASADGVGTKLELAKATGSNREVGVDLVAMCVNDILAQGAMPLFFLDYFATGRLDRPQALEVVAGIADACVESNCALIGGETAEMPGMYPVGSFDLAGFCVGAAERGNLLSPEIPKVDDIAIGLPSSEFIPMAILSLEKYSACLCLNEKALFKTSSETLGAALMEPTRIYQKAVKTLYPLVFPVLST